MLNTQERKNALDAIRKGYADKWLFSPNVCVLYVCERACVCVCVWMVI